MDGEEIKNGDQVMVRRKMRNGNLIRYGIVLRADAGKDSVLISFPNDYSRAVVPRSQVEKTGKNHGPYTRVPVSPIQRMVR